MSDSRHIEEVAIIGAGPAGLSLAYELESRRIAPVVLERGESPGTSWRSMYQNLDLGPWASSTLPGSSYPPSTRAFGVAHRSDFVEYLTAYANQHVSRVICNVEVGSVRRSEHGFLLETTDGDRLTRYLVNATGYFGNPYTPELHGASTTSMLQMHSAEYQSAAQMHSHTPLPATILVVGRNLSAGEMMTELVDAGYNVELSMRGDPHFGRSLRLQRLIAPAYFAIEDIRIRRNPNRGGDSHRAMDGGRTRKLISQGDVPLRPEISVLNQDTVKFVDGTERAYDVIMYATGYRPDIRHLEGLLRTKESGGLPKCNRMESVDAPGLFFLGLDNLRNFRSRFIRGIREDAAVLAQDLSRRLRSVRADAERPSP